MNTLLKPIFSLLCLFTFAYAAANDDIVGFWKTINDETGKPESIVAIYSYQGKFFGRIIATYNEDGTINDTIYSPKDRAPGVKGNPFYSGLDIIWDLEKNGSKYTEGQILDPEHGKTYDAEVWRDKGNLIVRGEMLFFGVNQEWKPASPADFPKGFKIPNLKELVPSVPEVN